ncbi:MAG: COX15/CtaA family protein [Cytophagales bacterium]
MIFLRNVFRRASLVTVANVYLLILAGGIVRCTGSGMGCPDWPKCFGRWIPPTKIAELPSNFVELYSKGGHISVEFNVYKTWTEYVNRLLGVLVGFSIFITLIASAGYWKSNRLIVYCSFVAFILVGFEGWIGAKVVDSNLKPIVISVHMLFALLIVALLIKALAIQKNGMVGSRSKEIFNRKIKVASYIACAAVLIQILIGTQVRQVVDNQVNNNIARSVLVQNLGNMFSAHIVMAYLVVFSSGYLLFEMNRLKIRGFVLWAILACILIEYGGGIFMYRFALPAFMQPVHLTCASVLFGLTFYLNSRVARQ